MAKKNNTAKAAAAPAVEEEVTTNDEGVEEETTEEEGTEEAAPAVEEEGDEPEVKASEALVYNRHKRLMKTYTLKEHGNGFVKLANELVNQPRRNGWMVVVR